MGKINLSKRLEEVTKFTIQDKPIADIGSDHAYVPIYLIQHDMTTSAIAGEVVEGPYKHAVETVEQYKLDESVDVRFGDGLNVLHPNEDIGTIFICGMGGLLISEIIADGKEKDLLPKQARLVLQPNNNEKNLREYLIENSYEIIEESIVEDNRKIYEIIVAELSDTKPSYSEEQLVFGPKLLETKSSTFLDKWQKELAKNENIQKNLKNTENNEKIELLKNHINQIEKVIS